MNRLLLIVLTAFCLYIPISFAYFGSDGFSALASEDGILIWKLNHKTNQVYYCRNKKCMVSESLGKGEYKLFYAHFWAYVLETDSGIHFQCLPKEKSVECINQSD